MQPRVFLIALTLASACLLAGCSEPRQLQYGFTDAGQYRVDDQYQLKSRLVKRHQRKTFSESTEIQHGQASYRLRVRSLPAEKLELAYRLWRLRIHDPKSGFKLEIGPEAGWIALFEDHQSLADYLGPEDFKRYQELVRQPLAIQVITPRGEAVGRIHYQHALLELLGKNRVLGKKLVKALKLPPLTTIVLPDQAVAAGQTWNHAYAAAEENLFPGQTVRVRFRWEAWEPPAARLAWRSRMRLTGSELQAVGAQLGVSPAGGQVRFRPSEVRWAGSQQFLPSSQRPESGRLAIAKHYRLRVGPEDWHYYESEHHGFVCVPE